MSDRKPDWYEARVNLEAYHSARFKTREGAEEYLRRTLPALAEANKLADGEIWTSIELIYITRIDCSLCHGPAPPWPRSASGALDW